MRMLVAVAALAIATSAMANDVTVGLTGQGTTMQEGSFNQVAADPPSAVPEPSTLWLLAIGGVALWRKRK